MALQTTLVNRRRSIFAAPYVVGGSSSYSLICVKSLVFLTARPVVLRDASGDGDNRNALCNYFLPFH